MLGFRFNHVYLESLAIEMPTDQVTSAELEDRLAPLYKRLNVPFGTLERLSGINSRYFWKPEVRPSKIATVAVQKALDGVGWNPDRIKALFSCSVTRDYFEPATACLIHRNLQIPESSIAMDISNACLGFSDGILMLGNMIESGVVDAGVVVSAENISSIVENSIAFLADNQTITREELIKIVPTFTLGCGAVAYVLCHEKLATSGHQVLGAVSRAATQHNELCEGNGDYCVMQKMGFDPVMYVESGELMSSAASLGGRTWPEASELLGWSADDVDHVFCHQVGRQVNNAFYAEIGLPIEKEFTIYERYGNLVSAAMPSALAIGSTELGLKSGDKAMLLGFGSGLNSAFFGIEW